MRNAGPTRRLLLDFVIFTSVVVALPFLAIARVLSKKAVR